ncbi:MAG TPA: hypothetical protein VK427_01260 [Kofleriaceae bacterium]|nr:hypothetical protein [Kofleriaceae bacterium]
MAAGMPAGPTGIFGGLTSKAPTRGVSGEVAGRGGPGPQDQHFGADEHQVYGNEGARKAGYTGTYAPGSGAYPFELTQGDISLLAGDLFDAREPADIKVGPGQKKLAKAGVFDSLWKLARTPSRNPGREPGTQDEIVYALYKEVRADARFQSGGVWAPLVRIFNEPSNAVKRAVESRYLWSASANFEHFSHPGGKHGPKESEDRGSARGSYRAQHEAALKRAYGAKQAGEPVNDAMAHDAAAQHFLQDGFSAGHVRTPRREIAEYWDANNPLLNEQFKKSIAQSIATYINKYENNLSTTLGSVQRFYSDILRKVDAKASAMPPITMDPLVGLVAHDVDNHEGVWVKNDWAAWQAFGDGHGNVRENVNTSVDTRTQVEQAVALSVHDIQAAYDAPANLTDAALFAHVRSRTRGPAAAKDSYGGEQAMPEVDSSKEASRQNWKVSSLRELWTTPVRSDGRGGTYGDIIRKSFDRQGTFNRALTTFHDQIDVETPVPGGAVHPQVAFANAFMNPMIRDPLGQLEQILQFDPAGGQNYVRDDDSTMEDLSRLDKLGAEMAEESSGNVTKANNGNTAMRWLSNEQRAQYIKNVAGGHQSDNEIARIYELFVTAPSSVDRRAVFRLVEGHSWSGNLTRRDTTLWMVFLEDKRRTAFVQIMNVGSR